MTNNVRPEPKPEPTPWMTKVEWAFVVAIVSAIAYWFFKLIELAAR